MTRPGAQGPLSGVRVLDLTHVLNGPFCTMLLAHMGADVIKVEHGRGDMYRHAWMPAGVDRDGYEFSYVNSNKRAVTMNLKDPRGKELFRQLVARVDVVVENFSAGVMDRLGLGYEALKEINPGLIYACSRGYGEDGPRSGIRANAATILASSGWTHTAWENAGSAGTKALGVGDEASGISMALGVVSALFARERAGVGQKVSVAMQEALLAMMVSTFHSHYEGVVVGRNPQQCADGYVAFHTPAFTDATWKTFAEAMGHPEAVTDPRFATAEARRRNFEELEGEVLPAWVREKTREEMWRVIEVTGVSGAPVVEFAEVVADAHLHARNAFVTVDGPDGRPMRMLAPWIRFSETPASLVSAGPSVGQHNAEVFEELLGLSADRVRELGAEGVL